MSQTLCPLSVNPHFSLKTSPLRPPLTPYSLHGPTIEEAHSVATHYTPTRPLSTGSVKLGGHLVKLGEM